ncbi:hypothetical protein [Aliarcobacter butzleri]|uniref:hypothetical protein n=1 Tax=Aliarcobacter butzleri TaxID=28197 RepID=UPI0024DE57A6|nr:hypothetical protein [Aliarcobacter butzleri]MDK2050570.1 hypothetical protein [Aliarcobacter butzleri]
MARNFWEQKSKHRNYFSFTNKTLHVIEYLRENEKNKNDYHQEVEEMIKSSPKYVELIKKLKEYGFDIEEFE